MVSNTNLFIFTREEAGTIPPIVAMLISKQLLESRIIAAMLSSQYSQILGTWGLSHLRSTISIRQRLQIC
jgi:hypothetical protein